MAGERQPSQNAHLPTDMDHMHFHAIQRSNGRTESTSTENVPSRIQQDLENRPHLAPRNVDITKKVSPYGHDDAADVQTMASLSKRQILNDASFNASLTSQGDSEQGSLPPVERHLQVAIPTSSPGLTTFAYQRALRNRIEASKLLKDNTYDLTRYTPTFIHDALMLPGSLAGLLSKGSAGDLINRMTPAFLPGCHAHLDQESLQPCLVRADNAQSYVQGMLVFGQGKASRDAVHQHYRPGAKRRKVGVEIDVEWTIEDSLAGTLEEEMPMRIELDGKGDEAHEEWLTEDSSVATLAGKEEGQVNGKHEAPAFYSFERDTWLE
ncbi:uncharacterized protein MYCGRDRAFT_90661 [Zymoseptoria tritici IPO323]|uniref:Uncharacterized protein n=1 Tax=Zymoseptoria tritici (strain CBS 115943 / IPO323) TaxID=336722 RepID=F9X4C4_ZYMTI|nr:uncharacterized protein MYCGRDRAFT_90661 [Zymoseptoria tritici IPO323]EGP90592.1 hypothetical protein MYCGRDRAFT_90661 [Zymoseptoria tritici IPO323]